MGAGEREGGLGEEEGREVEGFGGWGHKDVGWRRGEEGSIKHVLSDDLHRPGFGSRLPSNR